ncbi:MAG: trypsin-like peptidase domain-containing protein [Lachnospiraceae bacterium]|nr:trypsin-like peptidase domain-containing protein [Lachnospiraceae bacterium]
MAEKQEKNTGYTGEYGNPVEPASDPENQTEDGTYRYSYQKGSDDSVHSGNYYAGATDEQNVDAGNQQPNAYDQSNGSWQNQTNFQMPNNGGQNVTNSQMPNPDDSHYQNGNGPVPMGKPQKAPKKESGGIVKKLLVCAACAVVFGLVAGVCFQGVRYVSDQFLPTQSSQTKLKTTTQGSGSANTSNTASPDAKEETNENQAVTTQVGVTDVSSITEQTMPAIVAITSTTKGANYYDLFGREYEGQESTGAGSGFIIAQNDNELLIATNNHVIEDAKTISVQCIDGEIYEATVKGTDSANDLAVIAVAVKSIKEETMNKIAIADLGSSDDLKVGEMVIAIGNALGYGQSVTVGYVSAKDREISASEGNSSSSANTIKAIQTDAAINPGNSGGALINMRGEVIGINSAKIASSTVEGIGYAIPISVANPIIEELMNKEKLSDEEKGYLGISGQTVTDAATAFNIPNGVQVKEVAKGGAADKAGIQVGDIITSINNMEVRSIESLSEKANSYRKGTEVEIKVERSNNGSYEEKTFKVTLQGSSSLDGLSGSSKDSSDQSGKSGSGNGGSGNNNSGNDGSGNGYPGNGDSGSDDYGYDDGFGGFFDFFN